MSSELYEQFWQAISVIEAQDTLIAMSCADFPHLKQSSRQKQHKTLHKIAFPQWEDGGDKAVSPAEIISQMTKKMKHGR